MANATLSPEVTDLLSRANITEKLSVLPAGQLDRKLYEQVAKVIKLAGGVGKTNRKGFVFDSDPRAKLGLALETGVAIDTKKLRQAFYTPQVIAEELALLADVVGLRVLEPSAGSGALLAACLKFGASSVDCIELEETCKSQLVEAGACGVTIGDFLTMEPRPVYDRVVMNPPFTRSQDAKHVTHALKWLKPGGYLYAIVMDREHATFIELGARTVKRLMPGAFKESGTNIATRIIQVRQR